jgi:hypothetical protein
LINAGASKTKQIAASGEERIPTRLLPEAVLNIKGYAQECLKNVSTDRL